MHENSQSIAHANYQCSFCKETYDHAHFLTEGPGNLFICHNCVDLYRRHIEERAGETSNMTKIIQACSSCGTRAPSSHRYCFHCGLQFVQETKEAKAQ